MSSETTKKDSDVKETELTKKGDAKIDQDGIQAALNVLNAEVKEQKEKQKVKQNKENKKKENYSITNAHIYTPSEAHHTVAESYIDFSNIDRNFRISRTYTADIEKNFAQILARNASSKMVLDPPIDEIACDDICTYVEEDSILHELKKSIQDLQDMSLSFNYYPTLPLLLMVRPKILQIAINCPNRSRVRTMIAQCKTVDEIECKLEDLANLLTSSRVEEPFYGELLKTDTVIIFDLDYITKAAYQDVVDHCKQEIISKRWLKFVWIGMVNRLGDCSKQVVAISRTKVVLDSSPSPLCDGIIPCSTPSQKNYVLGLLEGVFPGTLYIYSLQGMKYPCFTDVIWCISQIDSIFNKSEP